MSPGGRRGAQVVLELGPQVAHPRPVAIIEPVAAQQFVGVEAHLLGRADTAATEHDQVVGDLVGRGQGGSPCSLAESEDTHGAAQLDPQGAHRRYGVGCLHSERRVTVLDGAAFVAEHGDPDRCQLIGDLVEQGLVGATI